MLVHELIERLSKLPPNAHVMILDGFNGGGAPRTINLGPVAHSITEADMDRESDCEDIPQGEVVYVVGFGCY